MASQKDRVEIVHIETSGVREGLIPSAQLTPSPSQADSTRLQNNHIGRESMAAKSKSIQTALTKGQIRKLNALRNSVGPTIGEKAFAEWLKKTGAGKEAAVDKNIELIAKTVAAAIKSKKLSIPRGGYLLTRGRGRVLVERAAAE